MILHNNKYNLPIDHNGIDYWYYEIGTDPIPFDSKNKLTNYPWSYLQRKHLSQQEFENLKKHGFYNKGVAIITGKNRRGKYEGKYLVCIDIDNRKGIAEFLSYFGNTDTLEKLAENTIIEQHLDNKDKAHIFYFSELPINKRSGIKAVGNRNSEEIPSIEIKSDESTVVICSPSIHGGGYPYQTIGTKKPAVLDKEKSVLLEDTLEKIYQKYGAENKSNNKIPISELFKPSFVVYEGNNRHEEVMRVMESLIQRNNSGSSLEQIKDICSQWNHKHCKPPLDDKEFEKQWICANNFINNKRNSENIGQALSGHELRIDDETTIYKITKYGNPYTVYYIDKKLGLICEGSLKDSIIYPLKSIINIIPSKLIYYTSPIFPKAEPKVQLEFEEGIDNFVKKIGPCNNINEILKILENNGHVLNKSKAPDAFNCVINAMKERKGLLVEYIEDITSSGYYIVKNELIKKNITQKSESISKEDAQKCCLLLDRLAEYGWINKNIFPTVLKWAVISPFSFVLKQLDKNNFLPWLILYGRSKSGKSTLGDIASKIWRIKDNDKGFSSINTDARLGHVLSQSTYPVLINEVGVLSTNNAFGKYNGIIEMIKSSITGFTARSKFFSNTNYIDIPALCPLILTSNHKIIEDSGFLRRFITIHFPDVEEKSLEQQEDFKEFDLEVLGILGDFIGKNISIEELKQGWKVVSIELLKKFYRFAGREDEKTITKWIYLFEEQKNIEEEVNEKKHFELRAFFIEEITKCYSFNNRSFQSDTDPSLNVDIMSALNFCLKNKLLPFLHEKNNNEIIITIDIMKKINIPNVTAFKDIASVIGFEYTCARIGSVGGGYIEENNKPMSIKGK